MHITQTVIYITNKRSPTPLHLHNDALLPHPTASNGRRLYTSIMQSGIIMEKYVMSMKYVAPGRLSVTKEMYLATKYV